jgi:peptide subunit release factor 1 (eRF1)
MLAGLKESGSCPDVVYLAPNNLPSEKSQSLETKVVNLVGRSDTGTILLKENQTITVVIPPVPLILNSDVTMLEVSELQRLLSIDRTIAVILLRLGRYAVSILEGEKVVKSRTGTRYVKNRHRAGGSSQRRFERSRDRLVRELFDKTCQTANELLPFSSDNLDHIVLGGEKTTIRHFIDRCNYLNRMQHKILDRRLVVRVPNQHSLKTVGVEAWKSQITVFKYS